MFVTLYYSTTCAYSDTGSSLTHFSLDSHSPPTYHANQNQCESFHGGGAGRLREGEGEEGEDGEDGELIGLSEKSPNGFGGRVARERERDPLRSSFSFLAKSGTGASGDMAIASCTSKKSKSS